MKLRNFSLGINSYPASAPGSNHTTARDVLNLRVDGDGYLRLAPGVTDWHELPSPVTGVARAYDHLFFLLEDGDLYKLTPDAPDTPTLVASTAMRGKLSVIDEFETFFLLTSESVEDPGYYFDVESGVLFPLKYNQTLKPPMSQVTDAEQDEGHRNGRRFFYVFAEVRLHSSVPEGSPAAAFHAPVSDPILIGDSSANDRFWRAHFSGISFNNDDTTHIYIYRSPTVILADDNYVPELTDDDAFDFFDRTQFYRVGQILRGTTTWADNNVGLSKIADPDDDPQVPIRWQEGDDRERNSLSTAHILEGLPGETRSWRHFNGYNFVATGARLRFSEVDFGVLKHAVFPEVNSINAPGDTDFVETFDETLLFGDSQHLNVLRGYDPFNFQIYQVATVGPVTAYSTSVLPAGGLGFVAQDGFYVYDGETVKEISTPQLDRFFENRVAVDGAVLPLPNSESLWSVEFDDGSQFTFLLNTERLDAPIWTRQSFIFEQGVEFPLVPLGIWSFDGNGLWSFGDGERWGYIDPDAQGIEQIFLVRNEAVVEQYLWHDLNSGVRAGNEWLWESNLMRGGSETAKVYDRLKLAGYAENEIDVDFELDIKGETVEKHIRDASFAKNSRKKRIPIKRRANSMHFQGVGNW